MLYGNLEYFSDSVYVTYSYLSPCLKYTFLYVFVVASLGNSVPSPWQVLAIQYCVPSPWQQIFPCISRKSTNALLIACSAIESKGRHELNWSLSCLKMEQYIRGEKREAFFGGRIFTFLEGGLSCVSSLHGPSSWTMYTVKHFSWLFSRMASINEDDFNVR